MEATKNPRIGSFVPAYIGFKDGKSSRAQAKEILDCVLYYHKEYNYSKVGITYSANNDQVENQIYPAYLSDNDKAKKENHPSYVKNKWDVTNIGGSGQADVMREIENLLNDKRKDNPYKDLRRVFFILPITTCATAGGGGAVKNDWLRRDIANLRSFMIAGCGLVLGWQNEMANDKSQKRFAVGGDLSRLSDSTAIMEDGTRQDDWVQKQLKQAATDFEDRAIVPYKPKKISETFLDETDMVDPQLNEFNKKKPHKKNETFNPSLPNTSNRFFHTKPAPDSDQVVEASKTLVKEIHKHDKKAVGEDSDFIIRKGNLNNTFKIAFSNAHDAQKFYNHLLSLGYPKKDTKYYGNEEKYPMNTSGFVDEKGAYRYIVRFEVPENALHYLQKIDITNAKDLFEKVMVDKPAKNILRK